MGGRRVWISSRATATEVLRVLRERNDSREGCAVTAVLTRVEVDLEEFLAQRRRQPRWSRWHGERGLVSGCAHCGISFVAPGEFVCYDCLALIEAPTWCENRECCEVAKNAQPF